MESATSRRRRRAAAAQVLLGLHAAGQLAEPERWDWDTLDRLPAWCLLDESSRRAVQLTAGGVLLAPALRLWIDRERIERARTLLGERPFAALLARADALAAARPGAASPPAPDDPDPAVTDADVAAAPDEVEARLLAAGSAVLRATLHASLPLGALADSLGESAGELPAETAWTLLAHTEALLAEATPSAAAAAAPDGATGEASADDEHAAA